MLNGTYSMRMGSVATLNTAAGANAIAIGSAQTATANGGTTTATVASGARAIAIGSATSSTAADTLALGTAASASMANAIAIGTNAVASAAEAVAIGTSAVATGGHAVSIGSGNVANGNGAVAIGDPNTATGNGAVTSGLDNTATGNGAVAIGSTNMVGGGGQAVGVAGTAAEGAVGLGYQNTVTGQGAVAIGDRNVANGNSAIALGRQTNATGLGAIAMGLTATASNTYAVAIGGLASATGENAVAVGQGANAATLNSLALGSNAVASGQAGDVALGSNSATAAVVATPGATIDGVAYTYAGTAPTSTVSVGQPSAERTITNVAAGRVSATSTDAINGSQLYATDQSVEALAANVDTLGTSTASSLGGTSAYDPTTHTVTAGLAVAGTTYTNVQDALTQVNTTASAGWNATTSSTGTGTVSGTTVQNIAPGATATYTAGNNIAVTQNGAEIQIATSMTPSFTSVTTGNTTMDTNGLTITGGPSVTTTGIDAGNLAITNVAPGVNGTDAVNLSQMTTAVTGVQTHYYSVNDGGTVGGNYANDGATGTNSLAAGVAATAAGTSAVAIGNVASAQTANAVAIGSNATAQGGNAVAVGAGAFANGIGASALGYLATATGQGSVAQGSNSTATGDGTASIGWGNMVGGGGQSSGTPGTAASGAVGIGFQNFAVGQGSVALGYMSRAAQAGSIAMGDTATAGLSNSLALGSGATANTSVGDVALGSNSVTAAPNPTASMTVNGTTYNFAGTTPTSVVSVGGVGTERQITNVAAGRISATSTDAINGSELYAVQQLASTGWNATTSSTGTGTVSGTTVQNIAPGATATYTAGNNIAVTQNGAEIQIATSMTPSFTSVTTGNTTMDNNGLTITGGPSVTTTGIDAGNLAITNVAAGTNATDAVNVGQLNTLGSSTASSLGGTSAYDPATQTVTAGLAVGGTTYTNVQDALTQVNTTASAGWNVTTASTGTGTATGTSVQNIAPGSTATFTAGNNIAVTQNGAEVQIATSMTPSFTSVTTGNTTMDTAGLTITGGPSVTTTGINAGGTVITNVAPGVAGTDATNVDQLNAVSTVANAGWNVTTGATGTGTATGTTVQNIAPGGTATFTAGNNIAITQNGAETQIATSMTPSFTSVTTGNTTMDTNGLTIVGGPSVTTGGINAGGTVITNVAPGVAGTDATNVDQLNAVSTVANAGWNVTTGATGTGTATGTTVQNIAPGSTATFTAGNNIAITQNGAETQIATSMTPSFTSVTTGNTTMDTTGLTITGGPSMTTTGINAGGTVITNVAPGVAGTDATNVDQLNAVSTVANAGWNVTTGATGTGTASGTTVQNIAPGSTATYTAGNNIAVTQNGAEIQIATSMTPSFTSVTVGDTVINDGSVSFTSGGPSITNGGIDAGGTVITNVAPGVAGTDAANVSQVTNLVDGARTHYYSVNDGGTVGGNFANDGATGVNAVASGVNATAAGDAAVAMGFGAVGSGLNAISIGTNAQATNSGSIAIGQNTVSSGPDTIAIGTGASATNSVALGAGASAGAGGTALGDGANATLAGGVALGKNSVEGAANATASTTIAGTTYNFAGTAPTSVVSVGAVGAERQITNVAAGQLSATSTDAINGSQLFATNQAVDQIATTANAGWNVTTGATGTGTATGTTVQNIAPGSTATYTAGNNIAVTQNGAEIQIATSMTPSFTSVTTGNTTMDTTGLTITGGPSVTTTGINAGGTVITNVAPGVAGTDATNVDQLNAVSTVANAGWNVTTGATGTGTATGTTVQNIAPGSTATYTAGNNIAVTQNGAEIQIATSMTPSFTSVTTGNTTMDTNGLTITGGPSVTTTGIDAGNLAITNVAAGTNATDAVNVGQLNTLGSSTASSLGGTSAYNPATQTVTAGLAVGGTTYTNVQDALTQVNTTASAGWNITDGTTTGNIAPNRTLTVAAGSNATTAYDDATGTLTVGVVADPSFNSVTVGGTSITTNGLTITGGPSVTTTGIDAGGTVITNVAPGVAGTDAANVSQVTNLVDGARTHYYSVNDGGTVGGNFANDGATGVNAVASGVNATAAGDAAVAMGYGATGSGLNAISIGTNAQATNTGSIAIGQGTVSSGPDTIAIGTGASATNSVALGAGASAGAGGTALGDGANATLAGGVALGKNSVEGAANATASTTIAGTTYNFAGTAPTSVVSVGAVGAERQITNVAAGQLSATSTDAINGSQLFATNQAVDQIATTANAGWNVTTGATGTGTATGTTVQNIAPGSTATYTAGNNIAVTQNGAEIQIATSMTPSFTSVTTGNTTMDNNGLTITGGPSVTTTGIDAGNLAITNVAAGTNATDAVNVGQLNTLGSSTASSLGGTSAYNPATQTVTAGLAVGGTTYTNVQDALTQVNTTASAGWNITDGTTTGNIAPNRTLTVAAGSNATTAYDDATGTLTVGVVADPSFNSVTVGGTSITTNGLTITGGPSVTTTGIDAGGTVITNVAPGVAGTDAANVSQVTNLVDGARTHYYSVNDGGTVGGNFANDGATGVNAVASGVNATAAGDAAVAMGYGATGSGLNAISIGTNAQATNTGSIAIGQGTVSSGPDTIAIGTGASATNSVALGAGASAGAGGTALGDGANATLAGGVALGKNSVEGAANATASTTIAGTTYNFAGTAPTSVVSVGAVGAERQITNVAAGRLSGTSTDAVNGSQLYATNQAIDQVAATANAGWNITDGTNSGNIAPNRTLTVAAGSNATTAYDDATGTLTMGVVADPSFNSIVVGGTSITTNGLTITGGPSVTTAGIDAGGTTITNVAAGTNATDAVNVSQLSTATAAVQTHYYSVNDGGVVGGNYANDGATGTNALAAGVNATAAGARSAAMGYGATASASDALALGAGATAANAGDVALGAGSVTAAASPTLNTTIAGTTYAFAGANPTSVVSVGSAGAERQVTNVAAGRLSGTSTDAVNGSQLYATNQAIESGLSSLSTTISTTRTHYYSVNDNGVVGGNYDNDGATGVNSLAAGVNAAATGTGSMALGAGASAVNANDVALGAGSVTAAANPTAGATIGGVSYGFAGALPTSVVSMGSVGAERQITNVAAGRLSGTSTDAVNGSQLYAVSEAINTLSTSTSTAISSLSTGLTVVQGDVTSLSTSTSTSLSTLVASAAPSRYYSVNDGGTQQGNYQNNGATGANSMAAGINAVASGADSVAIGSGANAGSDGATVIGAKAIVSADNGVAMGSNAAVTGANSVALGANSVADEANTVSVGSSGSERRITNVAPGVNSTDAVNVSQLRGVQQNINRIAKKAYAGVAGATALTMIPDVDAGKKFALGLGVGNYQGTAATAIGFTARLTENIKLRGGVSASSSGSTAGVGVSYQW